MNIKLHNKEIQEIWWPENGKYLSSNENRLLKLSATYHGDRDEFWLIEYIKEDGKEKEIARYNPRFVDGWQWK